jgi:hypothetical protein
MQTEADAKGASQSETVASGPSAASLIATLSAIALRPVADGKSDKVSTLSFKMQEAAISCLGLLAAGQYPHPNAVAIGAALTGTAEKCPQPELHFTVGTALSLMTTGPLSSAIYDELHPLLPASTPASDQPEAPLSSPLLAALLDEIFSVWLQKTMARARQAAGIWLVSLVRHCGRWTQVLQRLPALQAAFSDLLSEGDDFTQVCECV